MKPKEKEETYRDLSKKIAMVQDGLHTNQQSRIQLERQSQEVSQLGRVVDRNLDEMEGRCKNGERAHLLRQTRDDHQAGTKKLYYAFENAHETLQRARKNLYKQEEEATYAQKQINVEKGSRP